MFERGREFERGASPPSPLNSPLQPSISVVSYQCFWLERGRGEVIACQPNANRTKYRVF